MGGGQSPTIQDYNPSLLNKQEPGMAQMRQGANAAQSTVNPGSTMGTLATWTPSELKPTQTPVPQMPYVRPGA